MVRLTRTVRFSINPAPGPDLKPDPGHPRPVSIDGVNGFSAVPAMRGLGRHYELDVSLVGEPDATTGYLINIKEIDRAVRGCVIPRIADACRDRPWIEACALLPELWPALAGALPAKLAGLCWHLSPYLSVEIKEQAMATDLATVLIRQRFDLAAAHRLHASELSDADNRSVFGKCNNPSGHGHNYQIQTCIALPVHSEAASASVQPTPPPTADELERLIHETLVERFDHKHLNIDTPEFDQRRGGVNPSVENIARVFFDRLAPAITQRFGRSPAPHQSILPSLHSITVWETDRTSATYPANVR